MAFPCSKAYRAPCPPAESMQAAPSMVGTAHASPCRRETPCQRLCPPYKTVHYVESKENRPLFAALGQGAPAFLFFRLPRKSRGMARHKAHGLDFARPGPRVRGSRASPERRALGVKRHAPRLAAHQRGIFAFRRLTVVGPGRLLVADEAARARPGDEGCVSPLPAGAAPVPRRQDAS